MNRRLEARDAYGRIASAIRSLSDTGDPITDLRIAVSAGIYPAEVTRILDQELARVWWRLGPGYRTNRIVGGVVVRRRGRRQRHRGAMAAA